MNTLNFYKENYTIIIILDYQLGGGYGMVAEVWLWRKWDGGGSGVVAEVWR